MVDAALIRDGAPGDAAFEVALAAAILDAVARRQLGPILQAHRPPPTVAFGRQDAFRPGFAAAAAAASGHAFTPVLRAPGGHAAAYDGGSLVIDEVMPEPDSIEGIHRRFAEHAEQHARALRSLGVDARIGRVAGEYCPGDFTINAGGRTKLIGTAQRVVRGAWLFSTVVVVEGTARIRAVLSDVYRALELDWDPRTVGSVSDEVPGITVGEVEQALLGSYGDRLRLAPGELGPDVTALALAMSGRFRVGGS